MWCAGVEEVSDSGVGPPDVVTIEKSGENFRILYDVKGRFVIHRVTKEESECEE